MSKVTFAHLLSAKLVCDSATLMPLDDVLDQGIGVGRQRARIVVGAGSGSRGCLDFLTAATAAAAGGGNSTCGVILGAKIGFVDGGRFVRSGTRRRDNFSPHNDADDDANQRNESDDAHDNELPPSAGHGCHPSLAAVFEFVRASISLGHREATPKLGTLAIGVPLCSFTTSAKELRLARVIKLLPIILQTLNTRCLWRTRNVRRRHAHLLTTSLRRTAGTTVVVVGVVGAVATSCEHGHASSEERLALLLRLRSRRIVGSRTIAGRARLGPSTKHGHRPSEDRLTLGRAGSI